MWVELTSSGRGGAPPRAECGAGVGQGGGGREVRLTWVAGVSAPVLTPTRCAEILRSPHAHTPPSLLCSACPLVCLPSDYRPVVDGHVQSSRHDCQPLLGLSGLFRRAYMISGCFQEEGAMPSSGIAHLPVAHAGSGGCGGLENGLPACACLASQNVFASARPGRQRERARHTDTQKDRNTLHE